MTLIERVIVEADSALESQSDQAPSDRYDFWRTGINFFFAGFGAHKGVSRAGYEARATISEAGELWSRFMQKWIDNTARHHRGRAGQGRSPADAARCRPGDGIEPDERAGAHRDVLRRAPCRARGSSARHPRAHLDHHDLRRRRVGRSTATPGRCRHTMRTYVRVGKIPTPAGRAKFRRLGRPAEFRRLGRRPPSCTLTSIRSTHRSSSATTPRCGAGR